MITQEKLIAAAKDLVKTNFNGDLKAMFDHYDKNRDGNINYDELENWLEDLGAVSRFTEWAVARAIMNRFDPTGNGLISWKEFNDVIISES